MVNNSANIFITEQQLLSVTIMGQFFVHRSCGQICGLLTELLHLDQKNQRISTDWLFFVQILIAFKNNDL